MTSLTPQNINKSTGMYGINKAVAVPDDFFGFCVLDFPVTSAPTIPYSIFRTHDCRRLKWWDIQPTARNSFTWGNADTILNYYLNAGKDVLFTLYGTPTWASARPTEALSPYNNVGGAAEPADMNDWANYCIAIATRYPTIKYFEVWNEPSPYMIYVISGTSGSNTLTIGTNNSGLIAVGSLVSPNSAGIPANCTVTAISGSTVTLSGNLTANITNTQIEFSQFFTRNCTGTINAFTITVSLASNIAVGAYLSLGGIRYTVMSVAGTTVTLGAKLLRSFSSESGTFSYAATNLFFTGWRENLATMARVASLAIKSANPNAKILSPPSSQIASFFYPNINALPGNDLTENIVSISASYFVANPYNRVTQILTAQDVSGFVYMGVSGYGTKITDWVDIIAEHTYINTFTEHQNVCYLKYLFNWLAGAGINKPVWATEAGVESASLTDAQYIQTLSRIVLLPALQGCARSIYYGWDFGAPLGINTLSVTVLNALAYNINFVRGKTCVRLLSPYDGGPITAYFTDGSTLVF